MPFPIDIKYIEQAERDTNKIFPEKFKAKMIEYNGGELTTDDDNWILFPFLDQSDSKRLSRTCNHILFETEKAKEWIDFPKNAIAIGENGYGDYLILQQIDTLSSVLSETLFAWRHENGKIDIIADSVDEIV
jgi:hypothetical protein